MGGWRETASSWTAVHAAAFWTRYFLVFLRENIYAWLGSPDPDTATGQT
jgi:hypothetical protein